MSVSEYDVSQMRSRLHQIQAQNAELEREIYAMCNSVRNANDAVSQARSSSVGALQKGETTLNNGDNTLQHVDEVRESIKEQVILYKNIENAHKNIRRLTNDLRYQQGSEKTVKNIVIAMMDNEGRAFVSDEAIVQQAEKLYLDKSTQGFFLTHIMMDLQLKKRGEKEAAARARAKAVELDPRAAAWVYFMIAMKMKDVKEQNLWLDKITARHLVGAEKENLRILTMLSLKSDDDIAKRIAKYIGIDSVGELDRDEIVASILESYRGAMTDVPPVFKYIKQYVAEQADLHESLRGAMNNENVAAFIQQTAVSKDEKMRDDIITKMLDTIIEESNSPQTNKILKEIQKHQHVIDAKGKLEETAALDLEQDIFDASDLKLEDCLYDWITEQEHYNGRKEINDFAYSKLRPCYRRAYHQYLDGYHKKNRQRVSVNLGGYQTQSTLTDAVEETAKIEKFCKDRCEREKAAIKNTKFILLMVFGGIMLAAGFILFFIPQLTKIGNYIALFGGIAAGLILLICGVVTKFKNYRAKIAADQKCEKDILIFTERMQYLISDMANFREMYRTYDDKAVDDNFF